MENKSFSIVCPLKDSLFEYLLTHFPLKPLESTEELLLKEKKILELINASDRGLSKLEAWKKYYRFISKNMKKDELRNFLFLEHCTKTLMSDKDVLCSSDYLDFWVTYANKCVDESDIFDFMKKREIGVNLSKFYYYMSIHFEQEHKFEQANLIFLEGFSKNLTDSNFLKNNYNIFEQRMENRLNRDLTKSKFKNEELYYYIQKELNKSGEFKSDLCKFTIKGNKINFLENSNVNTLKYGDINVYIDPENRKKLITRWYNFNHISSQIVEIHKALSKILAENDVEYKSGLKEFHDKYKKELEKKPFSWLNNLRILSKNVQENIPQQSISNNNTKLSNAIPFKKNIQETAIHYHPADENNCQINNSKMPYNLEKLLLTLKTGNNTASLVNVKAPSNPDFNCNLKITTDNESKHYLATKKVSKEDVKIKFEGSTTIDNPSEGENKEKKIRLVKKENTKTKQVKMYINLERLKDKDGGKYLSLEEAKSIKYFKAIEERKKEEEEAKRKEAERLKKKRKTIIYHVDSDGDIIMSSDEEEQKLKEEEIIRNYVEYSKKKLINKKFTEENSINLWDSIEKTKSDVLEEMKRIEQLIKSKLITDEQKIVLFEDLEAKMSRLEELNKNYESRKNRHLNDNIQLMIDKDLNPLKSSPVGVFPNELINYLPDSSKTQFKNYVGKTDKKEDDIVFKVPNTNFPVSSISTVNVKNKDITNNIFSTVTRSIDFTNLSFNDEESNIKQVNRPEDVYNSLFSNFKEETENNRLNYFLKSDNSVTKLSNSNALNLANSLQQGIKPKNENMDFTSQRNNNIKLIINNNNSNNYTNLNNINFDNKNNLFNEYMCFKNTENEKPLNMFESSNLTNINTNHCKNPIKDSSYNHLTTINKEFINKVNSKKKGLDNLFGSTNDRMKEDLVYKLSSLTEKGDTIYEDEYSFKKKN